MPKITLLNQTSVAPTRLPNARVNVTVTPEQIAGPQVRLLQSIGAGADQITDFVIKRQNALDLDTVTRGENAAKEILMEQSLASQLRKGSNAQDLLQEQSDLIDGNFAISTGSPVSEAQTRYNKIFENADERQQAGIRGQVGKISIAHLKSIGAYESNEIETSVVNGLLASVDNDVARALLDHNNAEVRTQAMSSIHSNAMAVAAHTGEDSEVTELRINKAITSLHTGTIDGYLGVGDYVGAEEYFGRWKDEIRGDTTAIQNKIKIRKSDLAGESLADEAFALFETGEVFLANKLIDDEKDPDIQKAARTQFSNSKSDKNAARTEVLYNTHRVRDQAIFERDKEGKFVYKRYSQLPPDLREAIESTGVEGVTNAKAMFGQRSATVEPTLQMQAKTLELLERLRIGTPEEKMAFAKDDLSTRILSTENRLKYSAFQGEILNPKTDPVSSQKTDFLKSRIEASLFDKDNDGHTMVKAMLSQKFNARIAELRGGDGKRASSYLSFKDYEEVVNEVYKAGNVDVLKRKHSKVPVVPRKLKSTLTVSGAKVLSETFVEASDVTRNMTDQQKAAFTQNAQIFSDQLLASGKKFANTGDLQDHLAFQETNIVRREVSNGFDPKIPLMAIPEAQQDREAYVEIEDSSGNDIKVYLGDTKGLGLEAKQRVARVSAIRLYLEEHQLRPTLHNKAKALNSLGVLEDRAIKKSKLLDGKIGGNQKSAIFESFMGQSLAKLRKIKEDNAGKSKIKDKLFFGKADDILEFAINTKIAKGEDGE